jgi:hypothetical protein
MTRGLRCRPTVSRPVGGRSSLAHDRILAHGRDHGASCNFWRSNGRLHRKDAARRRQPPSGTDRQLTKARFFFLRAQVPTQLKGSAWFYNELVREPGEPVPETTTNKEGAYPDHCNFDLVWHVEKLDEGAWHINYHLGFRCCKSIP